MKRNKKLKKLRIIFVKLSVNNPKEGGKRLRELAKALENTKNITDTVYALTQIFGVSEKTIMRDLLNDTDL